MAIAAEFGMENGSFFKKLPITFHNFLMNVIVSESTKVLVHPKKVTILVYSKVA